MIGAFSYSPLVVAHALHYHVPVIRRLQLNVVLFHLKELSSPAHAMHVRTCVSANVMLYPSVCLYSSHHACLCEWLSCCRCGMYATAK